MAQLASEGGVFSRAKSGQCRAHHAFSSSTARITIVCYAVYFVIFLGLFFFTAARFLTSEGKRKSIAQWLLLTIAVTFMLLAQILAVITTTLSECAVLNSQQSTQALLPITWLISLGKLALFSLILLPLCRRLHHGASHKTIDRWILIPHSILVAVLAALVLAALAVQTRLVERIVHPTRYTFQELQRWERTEKRLWVAVDVVEVLGMSVSAARMGWAVSSARHLRGGELGFFIPLLIVSSVGLALTDLVGYVEGLAFGNTFGYDSKMVRGQQARMYVEYFFYAGAVLSAGVVVASRRLGRGAVRVSMSSVRGKA
ncbi:hypothetical protein ASPACDRAFT_121733 [Aspergillus aculeatus ATCC 16872]|uniref:Uncharacterized protein n=1 Tax=Aspergillus aculeatus (strain ATCC 16872 / CBS 172.66 / WB 5094) TaxID=690307 RepID=A0A1L9WSA1_ASPA1|nr:uncharacterized protein ASPACDRAFT_121733 [Aspergillus aculeatus ATCC 16872]OJJ98958.1 hypothetical protein ASPACDRAFT_121733 [Aspergillus aculeatus ATCC 16872]